MKFGTFGRNPKKIKHAVNGRVNKNRVWPLKPQLGRAVVLIFSGNTLDAINKVLLNTRNN